MKEKPNKTTKQKVESIPDREQDEKHDTSFLNLPTNSRENAEGFGDYRYTNYNY